MAVQVNQKDGRRNQNQRNGPSNQQTEHRDSGNNQHDNRVSNGLCKVSRIFSVHLIDFDILIYSESTWK